MQIEPGLVSDHPLHDVIGCQRFASTQPVLFTGLLLDVVLQGLAGLKRVEPPAGSLAASDKRAQRREVVAPSWTVWRLS